MGCAPSLTVGAEQLTRESCRVRTSTSLLVSLSVRWWAAASSSFLAALAAAATVTVEIYPIYDLPVLLLWD